MQLANCEMLMLIRVTQARPYFASQRWSPGCNTLTHYFVFHQHDFSLPFLVRVCSRWDLHSSCAVSGTVWDGVWGWVGFVCITNWCAPSSPVPFPLFLRPHNSLLHCV